MRLPIDLWFCGWCGFGPNLISLDLHCPSCQRRKDDLAILEGASGSYQVYGSVSSGPYFRTDELLSLVPPEESSATQTPPSSLLPLEELDKVLRDDDSTATPVFPERNRNGSAALEPKSSTVAALITPPDQLSVTKQSLVEEYLFHPDNPWASEDLIVNPNYPGQLNYRIETGEPAKTPFRRDPTPQEKMQTQLLRNNGGPCEKCKKSKKRCGHRTQDMEHIMKAEEGQTSRAPEGNPLPAQTRRSQAMQRVGRNRLGPEPSPIQRRKQRTRRSSNVPASGTRSPNGPLTTANSDTFEPNPSTGESTTSVVTSLPTPHDTELQRRPVDNQSYQAMHRTSTGYRGANFEDEYANVHNHQSEHDDIISFTTLNFSDQTTSHLCGEEEDGLGDDCNMIGNVSYPSAERLAGRNLNDRQSYKPENTDQSSLQTRNDPWNRTDCSGGSHGQPSNANFQLQDLDSPYWSSSQQESFIHDPEFEPQTVDCPILDLTQMHTSRVSGSQTHLHTLAESLARPPNQYAIGVDYTTSLNGTYPELSYTSGEHSSSSGYAINTPSSNAQSNLDDNSLGGHTFGGALDPDYLDHIDFS